MTDFATETTNVRFLNQAFLDKLDGGPAMVKQAETAMAAFIRQRLREDGFARQIFTPQILTAAELDRDLHDQPRKIVEKEPDSVAAQIALTGAAEVRYFRAERYEVAMEKISSKLFKKSKFELATYATNISQVIQQNSVKDLQLVEDEGLMNGLKSIANTNHVGSGYVNGILDVNTTFNPSAMIAAINELIKAKQKPAKILIPYNLYNILLAQPSTVVGSLIAESHFRGEDMRNAYGYEFIPTNKLDLLSSDPTDPTKWGDMIGIFAPEGYLGQFYSLQEPTVFLKNEADMLEFQVYESVGIGLGNIQGFRLAKFDL